MVKFKQKMFLNQTSAGVDTKSQSDSAAESEVNMSSSYPHSDATELARDKSEEHLKEWENFWMDAMKDKHLNILGKGKFF